MIPPLIPANEIERVKELHSLNILDTLPDKVFDNITQLAANICNVPICLISFVDNDRQWFKSRYGLNVPETSRAISFCGHTINEASKIMEVSDASKDIRFKDNPLVTGELNLRFYAGAPLVSESGSALGTICVIDKSPKKLSKTQKESLKLLSIQVMSLLESESRNAYLTNTKKLVQENEVKLNTLIESVGDMVFKLDDKGKFEFANSNLEKVSGYTKKEIRKIGFWELVRPDHLKATVDFYLGVIKSNTKSSYYEFPLLTKSGESLWVGQNVEIEFKGKRVVNVYAMARNINELVSARSKILASEERYRLISENSRDIISLLDENLNYKFLSSSVKDILGYDYQELIGINAFDITHPEDSTRLKNEKFEEDNYDIEVRSSISRIRKKDGDYIWMESIIKIIKNSNDVVIGYQISSRDISSRNKDEQEIINNQAKIKSLIENTKDSICVIDCESKYMSFNDSFKTQMEYIYEFTPVVEEEVVFEQINAKCPGFEESVKKALDNNKLKELYFFEKDKKWYYFDCHYNPVLNQDNEVLGLTIRIEDVSESMGENKRSLQFKKSTKELYETLNQSGFTLYQQVMLALGIGLDNFKMDIGVLSTITNQDYTIDYLSTTLSNTKIQTKSKFKENEMYCKDAFENSIYKTIDETNEEQFKKHFCNKELKIKSYIGAPYYVNNKKRGTIWFGSKESKNPKFSDQEIEFINTIARRIGFLIEHHENRSQLLTEQAILKTFVSSAPASIAMFNEKTEYVAMSKKWLSDYGLEKSQVMGKSYFHAFPELKSKWSPILTKVLSGTVMKNPQYQLKREGHNEQWLKWEMQPWYKTEKEVGGIMFITEDITIQKQQQEEIKLAKELADKESKTKEQFLSTMSHEIRTPMNAIIGASNLLIQNENLPQQEDTLKLLSQSSINLLGLVNNILDYNKISSGKIGLESIDFNLKEILLGVKNTLSFKAAENDVDIVVRYDKLLAEVFIGDSIRMSQVITNLVENAVKFTKQGYVSIEAVLANKNQRNSPIRIIVNDNGIGIEKENLNSIFGDFDQGNETVTRKFGGTGLGLSISRKLIKLMGGDIFVESKVGEGSKFYFDIPLDSANNQKLKKSSLLQKLHSGDFIDYNATVLIVEDNLANQQILSGFLRHWGIEVDIANNGLEALTKLKNNAYQLIIMDVQMPEMDGIEATAQIRNIKDSKYSKIPIIALTANVSSQAIKEIIDVGMNNFVCKPFNPEELYSKISKYIIIKNDHEDLKTDETELTHNYEHDFPYLFEITFGDEQLIGEIIETIIETMPVEIQTAKRYYEEKSYEKLAEKLHKIKPNLQSLEFKQLFLKADRLDDCIIKNDLIYLEKNIEFFFANVQEKISEIERNYLIEK